MLHTTIFYSPTTHRQKPVLMDEKQLVEHFLQSRNEKAFLALYRSKTPRLYQIALRLCARDQHQAEELVQEMWLTAIVKMENFQWRSELRTWLTGILINKHRDKRKKEEREMNARLSVIDVTPEATLSSFFTTYDLEKAISLLPPGFRQIIILYAIEGYKHHEIAELLDISVGTSKSQLFHAKRALRSLLNEETGKKTQS